MKFLKVFVFLFVVFVSDMYGQIVLHKKELTICAVDDQKSLREVTHTTEDTHLSIKKSNKSLIVAFQRDAIATNYNLFLDNNEDKMDCVYFYHGLMEGKSAMMMINENEQKLILILDDEFGYKLKLTSQEIKKIKKYTSS